MDLLNRAIRHIRSGSGSFEVVFLTREGGASKAPYNSLNMSYNCGDDKNLVDKNYEKLCLAFELEREKLISLNQVHGDDVLIIRKGAEARSDRSGYDAVVTDDVSLCLSILTADCLPVFLYDDKKRVFSAVHAGWRGVALGIAKKALTIMREEFSCELSDIGAAIGPSIRKCCFEVKADVLEKLNGSVKDARNLYKEVDGKLFADLPMYVDAQLKEQGISGKKISGSLYCTSCEKDTFFSYRRDNVTGRQLSFIKIEA